MEIVAIAFMIVFVIFGCLFFKGAVEEMERQKINQFFLKNEEEERRRFVTQIWSDIIDNTHNIL